MQARGCRLSRTLLVYTNPSPLAGSFPPLRQVFQHKRCFRRHHEEVQDITVDELGEPAAQPREALGSISSNSGISRHRQPRTRKNRNWTNEELQKAIAPVDNGMSIKMASSIYNIPYSTFCGWCYGKTRSRDRVTKGVLTVDEETSLWSTSLKCVIGDLGYHLHSSR